MTAGYGYDGLRAFKTNSSGTYRYYVYDGDAPVVELSSPGTLTALATFGANGLVCYDMGAIGAVTKHFTPSTRRAAPRL